VTQLMKRASEQRKRKAGDKLTVCILEKMLWLLSCSNS
jgi:hypothetical protein